LSTTTEPVQLRIGDVFTERAGCPFCRRPSSTEVFRTRYLETAEANRSLPDVIGRVLACADCGVVFPSHAYRADAFPLLYDKTFVDLDGFDRSSLQRLRTTVLRAILSAYHQPLSLSRLLDAATLRVLQVPALGRAPRGLRILDVGCGFGEFLKIYSALGNDVVGTEITPAFVERLTRDGYQCRQGELHLLEFGADERFDAIVFRAVFYRTLDPVATLQKALSLLAPGGELVMLDPNPDLDGVRYFAGKQFPQGQFYIIDRDRYLAMLRERFGLRTLWQRTIYGRPNAPLKPLSMAGHVVGLAELAWANLLHRKPYMLSYRLGRS
jgi:SAM-dependent methyltransferase